MKGRYCCFNLFFFSSFWTLVPRMSFSFLIQLALTLQHNYSNRYYLDPLTTTTLSTSYTYTHLTHHPSIHPSIPQVPAQKLTHTTSRHEIQIPIIKKASLIIALIPPSWSLWMYQTRHQPPSTISNIPLITAIEFFPADHYLLTYLTTSIHPKTTANATIALDEQSLASIHSSFSNRHWHLKPATSGYVFRRIDRLSLNFFFHGHRKEGREEVCRLNR